MAAEAGHGGFVRGHGRVARARQVLRTDGLRSFCGWLFRLVTDPIASTQVTYELVLSCRDGVPVLPARVPAQLEEATQHQLPLLDALMRQPTSVIRQRLERGERGFIVSVGGTPAGVTWITPGPRANAAPGLDLAPRQAYLHSTRVVPEMRNQGLSTYLHRAVPALLAEEGFTEVFSHIEEWNAASLRAAQKANFRLASVIRCRRRLGRMRVEKSAAPPQPHTEGASARR